MWKERSRLIFLALRFHLLNVAELKMLAVLEAAVASFTAKKAVARRSTSLHIAASVRKKIISLPILLGNTANCYNVMYI